ncbi:MAG TPA: hypothetical protein ENK06_11805 [Gammaproteobacteria bacterium]|nr:hypothetical protein [Gammaproteobacteria bacterium]
MKNIILLTTLSLFFIGCATIKEQAEKKADDNQKVLVECTDKGTGAVKNSDCQNSAKKEALKVKDKMK